MRRLVVSWTWCFSLACILTSPASAQFSMDELAKTLALSPVNGKPGSSFIINRGVGDGVDAGSNPATAKLAEALGFVSADGKLDPICVTVPWSKTWLADVKKLNEEGKLKAVQYIDIGSPVAALEAVIAEAWEKNSGNQAGLRDYLKNHHVDAAKIGLKSIDEANLVNDKCKTTLGYFSQQFIIHQAMEQLRQYQLEVVRLKPGLTFGGPYAGHFEYNADALILEAWRTKALAPWVAERSWQNGDYSPQVLGYYLALARAADTKKTILCDIHVGQGAYPLGIRRTFFLGLAQGAKGFRFVGAIPPSMAQGKEGLPLTNVDTWKVLRELAHEASIFTPLLINAQPKAPDIGILVSLTESLWDPSAWVSEEAKAIFHAARVGGHSVAVISENDLQEGRFQKLATIFAMGSHLQRDTAKALKGWVSNGAAITCVGGPFLDEYNQPLTDMLELQGISKATWQPLEKAGPAKITLAGIKPTDNVKYIYMGKTYNFPVVYGKSSVTPNDAVKDKLFFVGKYNDGSPAVTKNEYEPIKMGTVWSYYSPLGSGWLKTSLPARAWKVEDKPDSYNHQILFDNLEGDAGDAVIAATGDARFDVITNNLAIETVLLENPKSFVMIAINWSNKPEEAWLTAQYIPKELQKVRSLSQGLLNGTRAGITVTLPKKFKINVADIIVFE